RRPQRFAGVRYDRGRAALGARAMNARYFTAAKAGVLALAILGGVACSGAKDDDPEQGSATTFIAFERDFAGFRDWEAFHIDAPLPTAGDVHTSGPRTEYLNRRPPHGASAFPVGTIIVKEIESDDLHKIFAMVKRGGDYNTKGPLGW